MSWLGVAGVMAIHRGQELGVPGEWRGGEGRRKGRGEGRLLRGKGRRKKVGGREKEREENSS